MKEKKQPSYIFSVNGMFLVWHINKLRVLCAGSMAIFAILLPYHSCQEFTQLRLKLI